MATIPLRPAAPPPDPSSGAWRLSRLLSAPHRLGFFSAALWLALSALWWLGVLVAREAGQALPWAVQPGLAHGLLLSLSFMPLFIVGFLFTAGPRWLGLGEVDARSLLRPVVMLEGGWALALLGFHAHAALAALGVAVVGLGWAWITRDFLRLVRMSRVPDRLHAQCVGGASVYGVLALALAAFGLLQDNSALVRAAIHLALWGFLAPVFAIVSHRMIPFFTSAVLNHLEAWRPNWLLGLMVGALAVTGLGEVAEALWGPLPAVLQGAQALVQLPAGGMLLWLAVRWGLVDSLRGPSLRLLAMLHGGFVWFGAALLLMGVSHLLRLSGWDGLGLAPLHALTMGYLGCTLIAMITRVASGHSGRPLAVDALAWSLYVLLQAAVLARVMAVLWPAAASPLLLLAVTGWALACGAWALRYGNWLGRPRADGRPG
ncbi:NnrS family protein [Inhella gelatinilytica]|uniref:NnrS family protein n=1 Tax=Inhella gelatinilytica TaxID=2795030 RepID=A0A931ISU6_9BURK|nr:NnrS family protein [Inhella gelatinilytica]MBH9552082.1 NnrS family protein [Inhella gelatinilytica]